MTILNEYTVVEKRDGLPVRATLVKASCHARALHRCISMNMDSMTTYQVHEGNRAGETANAVIVDDLPDRLEITHRCTGHVYVDDDPYGEQVPCKGRRLSNGEFIENCGEPCRWIMMKQGEGKPPWTATDGDDL